MAYRIPELDSFVITNVQFTGVTLGDGAYGKVEEVTVSETVCAAKWLHGELVRYALPQEERQLRMRFADECKILSQLRHPRIVQFLGIYYQPDSRLPLLIMERLLTDLHGVLEKTPNIPLNLKVSFLRDVAQGLSYLHDRTPEPIAHRDLTARNVLLNSAMVAKIADLGVSKIVNVKPGEASATMTRAPGNANYMPPEAVEEKSKYSTSIDIFSYGNLALFVLTQQFPKPKAPTYYDERNHQLVARKEIDRRRDEVQMLHDDLGRQHTLVKLVEDCLENSPRQRPKVSKILSVLSEVPVTTHDTKTILQLNKDFHDKQQVIDDLESQLQQKKTEVESQQDLIGKQHKQIDELGEENKRLKQQIQTLEEQVTGLRDDVVIKDRLINDKIHVLDGHKRALDAMQNELTSLQRGKGKSSQKKILLDEQEVMESQRKDIECLAKSYNEDVQTLRELVKYKDRQLKTQQKRLARTMQECHDKMIVLCKRLRNVNSQLAKSESAKLKKEVSFEELEAFVKHLEVQMQQKTMELGEDLQLPVDAHKLVVDKVLRANISLFYQHLDPSSDLPTLVSSEKKADKIWVDLIQQRQAKLLVLFACLLRENAKTTNLDLQLVCSELSGQEFIEPQIMFDYQHQSLLEKRHSSDQCSISSLSDMFLALLRDIVTELKQQPSPQTFQRIHEILSSLVLPIDIEKVAKVIHPIVFQFTDTLDDLFKSLSPYLNSLSVDLLQVIMQFLGVKTTISMVDEFIAARALKFGHLVLCQRSPKRSVLTQATINSIHTASLEVLRSSYPQLFATLPEHQPATLHNVVRVSVEVDRSVLCLSDYNNIVTALSSFLVLPKAALVHIGCSTSPLVLIWAISNEAFDFVKNYCGIFETALIEQRIVKLVIGDSTYCVSTKKESELMQASYHGLVSKVQDCLKTEVNVNKIFFTGLTALMIASQNGHERVVEILLAAGAAVDYEDQARNETALILAVFGDNSKVIRLLLAAGANIDRKNKLGVTPLSMASFGGHENSVQVLLGAGARVNDPNKAGLTPLFMASNNDFPKIAKHLLAAGANVNHRSKNDSTALIWASRRGHDKVVKVLVEAGAQVDIRDKQNMTALDWAKENGHSEVISILSSLILLTRK